MTQDQTIIKGKRVHQTDWWYRPKHRRAVVAPEHHAGKYKADYQGKHRKCDES